MSINSLTTNEVILAQVVEKVADNLLLDPLTSSLSLAVCDVATTLGEYGTTYQIPNGSINLITNGWVNYVQDAVHGDYFVILKDGVYTINFSQKVSALSSNAIVWLTTNMDPTISYGSANTSDILIACDVASNANGCLSWTGALGAGISIRINSTASRTNSPAPNKATFTMSVL